MAIIINFAGASLRKPGAYSRVRVAQGGAAQAQLGVVALIGESDAGDKLAAGGLADVTFGPDQFNDIVEMFGSGPLVDAAKLAISPSNDPQIAGGAQQLILCKTNASVKASLSLGAYGLLKAKRAGLHGNNVSCQIDASGSKIVVSLADAVSGLSEISAPIGGSVAMTIQVTAAGATAATMTISSTHLTTAVTGTGAASLNVPLAQFQTLSQLVDFINSQPGYAAAIGSSAQKSAPLSVLDRVSAVSILDQYSLVRDASDLRDFFATSSLVDFTPSAYAGLPAVLSKHFLSGGARGATNMAAIQSAMDELLKTRVNFIVPLFSRDSDDDVIDGVTDDASSYTIAAIHTALRTHVAQGATVKGRKERQGFAGFMGTFAAAKAAAADLGSARVSLCFQQVDITDAAGSLYLAQPHMLAVANAGMKAAAVVGLPNTFKLLSIQGFDVPSKDFDPETQADDAIDANLTFVERAPGGGFRFVLDNSTYGQVKDAWIYNRPSVLYAADTAAFSIRLNLETFVGQRNSDVSVESIKNLLISVLDGLRSTGIIVPDANTGGKGYKDLVVQIDGSVVKVSVALALVEGIEFLLADISVQRAVA